MAHIFSQLPSKYSGSWRGNRPSPVPGHVPSAQRGFSTSKPAVHSPPRVGQTNSKTLLQGDGTTLSDTEIIHVGDIMGNKTNHRKTKWATAAEVKAPPKIQPDFSEEAPASDVPSDVVDLGDNLERRQRNRQKADAEEYQLHDWTGGFAPAPVDWEERPIFNKIRYLDRISDWRDRLDIVETEMYRETLAFYKNDIVPWEWVPHSIDAVPVDVWWAEHLKDPSSDQDSKPFWRRFLAPEGVVLASLHVPDAQLDLEEHDDQLMVNAQTQTSLQAKSLLDNNRLFLVDEFKARKAHAKAAKRLEKQYDPSANPQAPKANVYIRPAEQRDLEQITAIYNYEVENDIICPEMDRISTAHIGDRWADVLEARLPYLVAVERSVGPKVRQKHPAKNENVVAFAHAADFNDQNAMYRFTVEIEVYVKHTCRAMGIGRCLMDRLLFALDSDRIVLNGCEYLGDKTSDLAGGQRDVCNIVANVPYSEQGQAKLEWLKVWLGKYGFTERGDFPGIGRKLGKSYDNFMIYKAIPLT